MEIMTHRRYHSRVVDLSLRAAWHRGLATGAGVFAALVFGLATLALLGALP